MSELERIRKECEDRAASQEIGGARWQFDMFWLVRQIDERDAILDQVRLLADQGLKNKGAAINVHRLDAALRGEHVIDHSMVHGEAREGE